MLIPMPWPSSSAEYYWDATAGAYQSATRISIDDFHYGPLLPGDRELGMLPQPVGGLRCLEVGCGAGQNSIYLARQGAHCVAVDISTRQLAHGKRLAEQNHATIAFRHDNMDELSVEGQETFDLVHSTYALPFSTNPARSLQQFARLLVPGGTLLLTTSHPLYSGEWMEFESGDNGLLLHGYFRPPADVRPAESGHVGIASTFHPVGAVHQWLRDAGLQIDRLLEPEPMPIPEMSEEDIQARVPYDSPDWRELYPVLSRIPTVVIFRCTKPHKIGDRTM